MGFKTTALKCYEPMLTKLTTELMLRLEEHVGKEINIDDWVAFLSFGRLMSDTAKMGACLLTQCVCTVQT